MQRFITISVRLTPEEYSTLGKMATREQRSKAGQMRQLIQEAHRKEVARDRRKTA
jgi:hypothetical protein